MNNYNTEQAESQEISATLKELSSRKAQQEYFSKKLIEAFEKTEMATERKISSLQDCGTYINLRPDGSIKGANFCKNKLCPMCQWRLSRKTFGKLAKMQELVEKQHNDLQYIFVTLTIRNMESLSEGIQALLSAFYRFSNDRTVKAIQDGFVRTMEVTYNCKRNTWHPHIHIIFAMKPVYFKQKYMRKATWAKLWQRALRADYIPQVDVRKVSEDSISDNDSNIISGTRIQAIAEIAKYAVKPFDLKTAREDETDLYAELLTATYHRRLRAYSGVYKEAAKAVGMTENEILTDEVPDEAQDEYDYVYINGEYRPHTIKIDKITGEVNRNIKKEWR